MKQSFHALLIARVVYVQSRRERKRAAAELGAHRHDASDSEDEAAFRADWHMSRADEVGLAALQMSLPGAAQGFRVSRRRRPGMAAAWHQLATCNAGSSNSVGNTTELPFLLCCRSSA